MKQMKWREVFDAFTDGRESTQIANAKDLSASLQNLAELAQLTLRRTANAYRIRIPKPVIDAFSNQAGEVREIAEQIAASPDPNPEPALRESALQGLEGLEEQLRDSFPFLAKRYPKDPGDHPQDPAPLLEGQESKGPKNFKNLESLKSLEGGERPAKPEKPSGLLQEQRWRGLPACRFQVGKTALSLALTKARHYGEPADRKALPSEAAYIRIQKKLPETPDQDPEICITAADGSSCEVQILQGVEEEEISLQEGERGDRTREADVTAPLQLVEQIISDLPEGPIDIEIRQDHEEDEDHARTRMEILSEAQGLPEPTEAKQNGKRLGFRKFRAAILGRPGWQTPKSTLVERILQSPKDPDDQDGQGSKTRGDQAGIIFLDPRDLRDALRNAIPSAAGWRDDPILQGVMVEASFERERVFIQSTDGRSMVLTEMPFRTPQLCEAPANGASRIRCKISRENAGSLEAHMRFAERGRIIAQDGDSGLIELTISPHGLIARSDADRINRESRIAIQACESERYPEILQALRIFGQEARKSGSRIAKQAPGAIQRETQLAALAHSHTDRGTGEVVISTGTSTRLDLTPSFTRILCSGKSLADGRRIETFGSTIQHTLENLRGTPEDQADAPVPGDWKQSIWVATHRLRKLAGIIPAGREVRMTLSKDHGVLILLHEGRSGPEVRHISVLLGQAPAFQESPQGSTQGGQR